jgi:phosphatidylglycerophosphate synthase
MPEQIEVAPSAIEATYKAREVEGIIDLYFYRKIGFRLAHWFAQRNVGPTAVTLLGGVFGIVAGHLYYYRDLRLNLLGIVLHVGANALDNADGQLARLLNQQSRKGRLLDGLVDYVIWLGIYLHLALRCTGPGGSSWIWVLAGMAILSHGWQAATADYCRNAYLYFAKSTREAGFDSSVALQNEYRQLGWRHRVLEKLLLKLYVNLTRQQELLVPGLKQLREVAARNFPDGRPAWAQSCYLTAARPLMKWCTWLMSNTRIFLLLFLFVIGEPVWFFWIEVTLFNALLVYVIFLQQNVSRLMIGLVEHSPPA